MLVFTDLPCSLNVSCDIDFLTKWRILLKNGFNDDIIFHFQIEQNTKRQYFTLSPRGIEECPSASQSHTWLHLASLFNGYMATLVEIPTADLWVSIIFYQRGLWADHSRPLSSHTMSLGDFSLSVKMGCEIIYNFSLSRMATTAEDPMCIWSPFKTPTVFLFSVMSILKGL